jgi:hypothetical protein
MSISISPLQSQSLAFHESVGKENGAKKAVLKAADY